MIIGVFADTHDHLDHVRLAVDFFNQAGCDGVLFAGDFVSTFVTPPLRRLRMPLIAVFGDNDGNYEGLRGGVELVGTISEGAIGIRLADGTRVLMAHRPQDLALAKQHAESSPWSEVEVLIHAHTHRPKIARQGRQLLINPGETSGWTSRRSTVALVRTDPLEAEIVTLATLPEVSPLPPLPPWPARS